MDLELVKSCLMWCTILNFGILVLWLFLILLAKDWFYAQQTRWFPMSKEDFIRCNYLMYGSYKLAIVVLNAIPWIALEIVT